MSSQQARPAERGYHQDYIARIRYENALPPPPGAPKLLNIPTDGLGYYTSSAFGSRLAKQQPLNIEPDAELGMPIDLVGMPGIFDGDESCKTAKPISISLDQSCLSLITAIQAPLAIPPIHPKDKNLLRPISELGKPKLAAGGHSFLRRTEYISSARAEAQAGLTRPTTKATNQRSRRATDASREDPINILRHIVKGFNLANPEDSYEGPDNTSNIRGAPPTSAEVDAWKNPKHPTKSHLDLNGSYQIKPDLNALPDSGTYLSTKFAGNPTNKTDAHDVRLDVGMILPVDKPSGDSDYEFYLPQTTDEVKNIQRQFNVLDPQRDDELLRQSYTNDGEPCNRYDFHRTYDLYRQQMSLDFPYKEVALAIYDPDLDAASVAFVNGHGRKSLDLSKGAYYYPIGSKMQLRPRRNKALVQLGLASQKAAEDSTERPDAWNVVVRDPDDDELMRRTTHRSELDPTQES